jgi:hypothetical protein
MVKKCLILVLFFLSCIINVSCEKKPQPREVSGTISPTPYAVTVTPIFAPTQIPTPTVSPTQVPAELLKFNSDMMEWLTNTTSIPIYLPNAWLPMKQDKGNNIYYFEAQGDADSYGINVYTTDVSVKFNDNNDLLVKNGPVSEADYIGTISGEKYEVDKSSFNIPKDANKFNLMNGITAYEKGSKTSVWWEENGWTFHFIGSYSDDLEALASAWLYADNLVSETGDVEVVGGNKLTFYYSWEKDGYQYGFTTGSIDFEETIKILNSFMKIDPYEK